MDLFKARKLIKAIEANDTAEVERLVVKYPRLLRTKLRRGESALHVAAFNHKEAVIALIRHGADVNARDDKGNTPLMNAAVLWDDIVELLIRNGADAKLRNKLGYTPVDLAESILKEACHSLPMEAQRRVQRIVELLHRSS